MGQFSETFMDHFQSPRHCGPMPAPDLVGCAGTPGRGPFFVLQLRVADGRVVEARFQTYGCGATIASGSVLTGMLVDRSVAECLGLTDRDIIDALEGVPTNKLHGPALAITALRNALKRYSESNG